MVIYKETGYGDCEERLNSLKKNFLDTNLISSVEYCAAFVAIHLISSHGSSWICGKLPDPIKNCSPSFKHPFRCRLYSEKDDLESDFYMRKCIDENCVCLRKNLRLGDFLTDNEIKKGIPHDMFIIDVFREFSLKRLPALVNHFLIQWFFTNRGVILLFRLGTVAEVLQMMSQGFRVLTLLINPYDLTNIYVDPYEPYEKRDNLSFSIHDMQHLERFFDDAFYLQQVGFLYAFQRNVFYEMSKGYNEFVNFSCLDDFKHDINHAISDMNACVIHMIAFFKAKWLASYTKICTKNIVGGEFNAIFTKFCLSVLLQNYVNPPSSSETVACELSSSFLEEALQCLCDKNSFTSKHAECIIQIFEGIGKERISFLLNESR